MSKIGKMEFLPKDMFYGVNSMSFEGKSLVNMMFKLKEMSIPFYRVKLFDIFLGIILSIVKN